MPLVSGHRVTLTYNLYFRNAQPQPGHALTLPVHSLPIYYDLQAALQTPGFMKSGGILGFYCNHAYPHSHVTLRRELPMALKGVDLLVYAVCRSLGLKTKARPILEPEEDDDDDDYDESQEEYVHRVNDAFDIHKKAKRRLDDFQNLGFHVPPYTRRHRESSKGTCWDRADKRDESLDPVLPEYQNTTDDPSKHPLAQHDLTLKYRNLGRELRLQQHSYVPTDSEAKIEYLMSNLEVEGLVPPPETEAVRVGSKFHEVQTPEGQIEDEAVRCSLSSLLLLSNGFSSDDTDLVLPYSDTQASLA